MILCGVGKADITGPIAGLGLWGSGEPDRSGLGIAEGLEQRQFARAAVLRSAHVEASERVEVSERGPEGAVIFVVCDLGAISTLVRARVVDELEKRFDGRYSPESLCLSAAQTRSTPGGYAYETQVASAAGHSPRYVERIVRGTLEAVERAEASLSVGSVSLAGVDGRDVQLSVRDRDGLPRGLLHWRSAPLSADAPAHRLIGGGRTAFAAWHVETLFGDGFVAAFAEGHPKDPPPGPRDEVPDSIRSMGERQAHRAIELFEEKRAPLREPVDARLFYVDFDGTYVPARFTSSGQAGPLDRSPRGAKRLPAVLPLQILRLGRLAVASVPFEVSSAAALRIRDEVLLRLRETGVCEVIVAPRCNGYAGGLATPEEHEAQRPTAASMRFGKEQLGAVRHRLAELATAMVVGVEGLRSAPRPRLDDMRPLSKSLDRSPRDVVPRLRWFGDVVEECSSQYAPAEVVSVTF